MALTSRISLKGSEPSGPEDYLSTSLGVIFPDDVTNQHGDAEHSLVYASPHLPRPLLLDLADPEGETDRRLFSHYLWNASLLLAELVERDTLGVEDAELHPGGGNGEDGARVVPGLGEGVSFDVRGKAVAELGAGTALPSMMAGLLGAERLVVTDYPAPAVIKTLRENIARNIRPSLAPTGGEHAVTPASSALVTGHSWGELPDDDAFLAANRHAMDRVLVADCLWMPWQHENLHRSIDHFLRRRPCGDSSSSFSTSLSASASSSSPSSSSVEAAAAAAAAARCWVVAGFHTGREKMRGFFDEAALARADLEVERIWERDCDGREREWSWDREDDVTVRKRWLVVAVLKRRDNNDSNSSNNEA
ncbi:Nicotinamide N-methyltransferase [Purpureocillium takamizusanense]|uniref:Nicotinamide N-methyltransferase n=1 Tax=Purpureocillium takamizusanense TaxID=2060973 RepID=A0A9Q8QTZ8_9HYPO|nr:Nicotinamide N-methyltransferase [Purpureocillium takamizusanense]UNI24442.1 Nicotinamide N-methyltransferase [Purpureocillium takamizusanense]